MKVSKESELSHHDLVMAIDYNPRTGVFNWNEKPVNTFHDKAWNTKYAGIIAGTTAVLMGKKYRNIQVNKRPFLAHRLAWFYMNAEWPNKIDHENGNGLDNSYSNLRNVTMTGNQRNRRRSENNTSGVTGVCFANGVGLWLSHIGLNGKQKNLGFFDYKWNAICARKSAEIKYGYHKNHGQVRPS